MEEKAKKKRKIRISDIIRRLILLAALCVFTYSAYTLTTIMLEYHEGDQEYADIDAMFEKSDGNDQNQNTDKKNKSKSGTKQNTQDNVTFQFDINRLQAVNSDAVGFIRQDNTLISYPIMQGSNNFYYLYHTIDHTYNRNGSIFMDYQNKGKFNDKNCVIYGHNMWTDTMFGTLTDYTSRSYYEAHPEFDIYAGNKHYKYRVFASFQADAEGDAVYDISFTDNKEFENWIQTQRSRSYLSVPEVGNLTAKDHIITLSTCTTRGDENKRVIVMLVRESEVK